MTTFKQAALMSLDNMKTVWKGGDAFRNCGDHGGCFWMAGNFFHTAVLGMAEVNVNDSYGFGLDALKYFDERMKGNPDPRKWTNTGIWIDDFGWWGLAFGHAHRFATILGYDASTKQSFADRAKNCWEAMNACWQTTSEPWQNPDKTKTYKVDGGVPNSPGTGELKGRNNVTNEVYWALSNMLTKDFGSHYCDANALASNFFRQGLEQDILHDANNFIYERLHYMPGHPVNADWTWMGDQGLFAYSCFDNNTGNEQVFGSKFAKLVLLSVIQKAKGVLFEDVDAYPTGFQMDYACGKGTFMRYLGIVSGVGGSSPEIDEFIYVNARAVWKNRDQSSGLFGFYWNNEKAPPTYWGGYSLATSTAILQQSGLSAIIAGLKSFSDKPIDNVAVTAGATS